MAGCLPSVYLGQYYYLVLDVRFIRFEENALHSLVFKILIQAQNVPEMALSLMRQNQFLHYIFPLLVWLHMGVLQVIHHPQMMKFHFNFNLCFLLGNLLANLGKR